MERRARVVLVDTHGVPCSNVCLMRAALSSAKAGRESWNFSKGGMFVGGDNTDNMCLVRCNGPDTGNIHVLMELSYVVHRRQQPGASSVGIYLAPNGKTPLDMHSDWNLSIIR